MVTESPPSPDEEPHDEPGTDEPWAYALELPNDLRALRVARITLRSILELHQMRDVAEVRELLASELVTNAYQHTDGPISMRARGLANRVRISVWDSSPVLPTSFNPTSGLLYPRYGSLDDDGGRGLLLLQQLADNWGGYTVGEDLFGKKGKLLWFEVLRRSQFDIAA
jgi:anti-sigma regulatory factor (Ser/Thr protein kinase)